METDTLTEPATTPDVPAPEPKGKKKKKTEGKRHPIRHLQKRGVPLIAIETPDPAATINGCVDSLKTLKEQFPIVSWDCVRGLVGLNEPGKSTAAGIFNNPLESMNPVISLKMLAEKALEQTIVFFHNTHIALGLRDPNLQLTQAIWNCRDAFKGKGAVLVIMAPEFKLRAELSQDVVIISEPAPTDADIRAIITNAIEEIELPAETVDMQRSVDGLTGYLSAYAVEQSFSIALKDNKEGIDYDKLWELKVASLKQTAGLEITLPKTGFDDMAGNEGVKHILRMHLRGSEPPRAVLWFDEIEKMIAASGSDLSGTTQAVLEQYLYWTQSRRVKGFLLAGVPGAGKSLTCQAIAGEAKCPLLRASMSTVKGSLVGETQQNTARLFKAVDAVAQGRVLMVSTCNSLEALSPEVMARHNMGMIFYDFPNEIERKSIVDFYRKKYSVAGEMPANTQGWVGREIEACFEKASLWKISLAEAAKTVVTSAKANAERLDDLRRSVAGRFLSAAKPGIYEPAAEAPLEAKPTRRMNFETD